LQKISRHPFNRKQNYSNYITVTIAHPITREQLSNTATAAGSSRSSGHSSSSAAVAIAAIAAAAAATSLRFAFDYRQYASTPIEQNRGAWRWKINVPFSDNVHQQLVTLHPKFLALLTAIIQYKVCQ